MARSLSPDIEAAIQRTAQQTGVDPKTLRTFVLIESGGDPYGVTGSYKGLMQLSKGEFEKNGGKGQDIFDPEANLAAGATKLKAESADFERRYGRQPTPADLYMIHQQGAGGSAAHWANPDAPAWQNMASTAEGQNKGEGWAKQAIWGNIPDADKARFGSVDNVTSKDFVGLWNNKVARFSGDPVDATAAAAPVKVAAAPVDPWPIEGPALPASKGPSAQPFSMAALANVGSSQPAQATAPAAPTAPASPSFFGSLADSSSSSSQAQSPLGTADEQKADEQALFESQSQNIAGVAGRKPIDLARLASILQSRARLGTA